MTFRSFKIFVSALVAILSFTASATLWVAGNGLAAMWALVAFSGWVSVFRMEIER